ncbi:hypothetical protein ATANTOWER_017248, partial [Ataeniobius toweri]|nr:hypothetical protein [Ataeniobius toweri]
DQNAEHGEQVGCSSSPQTPTLTENNKGNHYEATIHHHLSASDSLGILTSPWTSTTSSNSASSPLTIFQHISSCQASDVDHLPLLSANPASRCKP